MTAQVECDVVTCYVEIRAPELPIKPASVPPLYRLIEAEIVSPELNRFLYTAVGGDWFWSDRLEWSYEQWLEFLARDGVETWVAYVSGTPAGYFELEAEPDAGVKIAYFGLLPQFIGKGLGGALLYDAISRARALGATRVWTHTCSLDHPNALNNYLARGFREFHRTVHRQALPERAAGPWPGARTTRPA